jgi:hypothetical protein
MHFNLGRQLTRQLHLLLGSLAVICFGSLVEAEQATTVKNQGTKPFPVGVYDLMPGDAVDRPILGIANNPCWRNPNITGVCLRTDWNKIEPQKGVFDWTFFDDGVAAAAEHNKLVALTVYSGKETPDWVYADGARRLDLTKVGRKGEMQVTMPAPWDQTFLEDWHVLVAALGKRYDSNPVVSYVTMTGPGRGGELYFVNSPQDLEMLQEVGGLRIWVNAAEKIASFYAAAFPSTPCLYATGEPVPGPEGEAALAAIVDYCEQYWPDRFGIRSSGLRPGYPARGFVPQSRIRNKGYQMLKPFRSYRGQPRMLSGTLAETLELGMRYGGRFVEVYDSDCVDPSQGATLNEANKRFKLAYSQR